jgi:hypothetical protein
MQSQKYQIPIKMVPTRLKPIKKNSTFLMWSGIGLFALAMLIAGYIYYSKIFSVDISNLSSFHLVLLVKLSLRSDNSSFSILSILVRFKEAVKMPVAISMPKEFQSLVYIYNPPVM